MTYLILLAVAGFFTYLLIRRHHIAFAIGGLLFWLAVWGYHLTNPPTNIVQGTFVYDLMYYAYIIMAIAVFFIYIGGRNVKKTTTGLTIKDGRIVSETVTDENAVEENIRDLREVRAAHRARNRALLRMNRR